MTADPTIAADTGLAEMQDAVATAWAGALTPPDLREACLMLARDSQPNINKLRAVLVVLIGVWIKDGERHGHDRHVLEQVAATEGHAILSIMMRAAKERRGEPFVPARMAIVAYAMAKKIADAEPFRCDLDDAAAAFEASLHDDDGHAGDPAGEAAS